MYNEIREKLIELGYDEWIAGMTAEKISDIGAETILSILQEILSEDTEDY